MTGVRLFENVQYVGDTDVCKLTGELSGIWCIIQVLSYEIKGVCTSIYDGLCTGGIPDLEFMLFCCCKRTRRNASIFTDMESGRLKLR